MQTASPSTSSQVASPARTLVSQGLEAAKGSGPPSRGPARACGLSISASSASLSPNGSSLKMCPRSEEHTSELQSLMRISYSVFCLIKTHIYTTLLYNIKNQQNII